MGDYSDEKRGNKKKNITNPLKKTTKKIARVL